MVVCLRLAIASALSSISLALLTVCNVFSTDFNRVLALPLLSRALICAVTAHAARALSRIDIVRPCPLLLFILLQASWARVFTVGPCVGVK